MKNHLISFALGALTFMCVGCKKEPKSSLVIVGKGGKCTDFVCYEAVDANGNIISFPETDDAYRIGDTIK